MSRVVERAIIGKDYKLSQRRIAFVPKTVAEADAGPDLGDDVRGVQASPALMGHREQLERHRRAGRPGAGILGNALATLRWSTAAIAARSLVRRGPRRVPRTGGMTGGGRASWPGADACRD